MKNVYFALIVWLFVLPLNSNGQSAKLLFESKVPVSQMHKDIDKIHKDLKNHHPNVYLFISKNNLKSSLDSLKQSIKSPLTRMQFRYVILTVLQKIGDGHLTLTLNGSKVSQQDASSYFGNDVLPVDQFNYRVIGNKLYFFNTHFPGHYTIEPGSEIVAINDISAKEIIGRMINGLCSDGLNETFKYFTLNAVFGNIYANTFGRQDTLTFQVKTNEGTQILRAGKINGNSGRVLQNAFPAPYFRIVPDVNLAVLTLNSFEKNVPFNFPLWFKQIKVSQVGALVLDLRNNKGGEQLSVTNLFSYLISKPTYFAKVPSAILNDKSKTPSESMKFGITTMVDPAENSFKGKIYLLINGGTFSAAAILAANLNLINPNIIIVGEESGGGRYGCTGGLFRTLDLADTNLSLSYGQVPIKSLDNSEPIGRGVIPDILTRYVIDDYIQGRDLESDWVLNDLAKKKN
ncbi:S41 family peptidase [Pedobacter sp. GR22-6]|uniref:S41 family peptidase n=1 Tax=Pedobacter sp. GR22-6 TaxID=3127957 RepID=UPI00307F9217